LPLRSYIFVESGISYLPSVAGEGRSLNIRRYDKRMILIGSSQKLHTRIRRDELLSLILFNNAFTIKPCAYYNRNKIYDVAYVF